MLAPALELPGPPRRGAAPIKRGTFRHRAPGDSALRHAGRPGARAHLLHGSGRLDGHLRAAGAAHTAGHWAGGEGLRPRGARSALEAAEAGPRAPRRKPHMPQPRSAALPVPPLPTHAQGLTLATEGRCSCTWTPATILHRLLHLRSGLPGVRAAASCTVQLRARRATRSHLREMEEGQARANIASLSDGCSIRAPCLRLKRDMIIIRVFVGLLVQRLTCLCLVFTPCRLESRNRAHTYEAWTRGSCLDTNRG
jgi:hypothetical protein